MEKSSQQFRECLSVFGRMRFIQYRSNNNGKEIYGAGDSVDLLAELLLIALKTGSVEEVWKDGNPACGCSSRLLRVCLSLCGSVSVLGNNLGTQLYARSRSTDILW